MAAALLHLWRRPKAKHPFCWMVGLSWNLLVVSKGSYFINNPWRGWEKRRERHGCMWNACNAGMDQRACSESKTFRNRPIWIVAFHVPPKPALLDSVPNGVWPDTAVTFVQQDAMLEIVFLSDGCSPSSSLATAKGKASFLLNGGAILEPSCSFQRKLLHKQPLAWLRKAQRTTCKYPFWYLFEMASQRKKRTMAFFSFLFTILFTRVLGFWNIWQIA